jgi:hypothetical protein
MNRMRELSVVEREILRSLVRAQLKELEENLELLKSRRSWGSIMRGTVIAHSIKRAEEKIRQHENILEALEC